MATRYKTPEELLQPTAPLRPLLDAKAVAAILTVHPMTVYELWKTGALPSVAIGRRRAMTEEDLRAYIEAHRTGR